MRWTPVESGVLAAVRYHADAQQLQIRFKEGHTYEYRDVPAQVHTALMRAQSKGRYFNLFIRAKFRHRRCDEFMGVFSITSVS